MGTPTLGVGLWGQLDLAGNVFQWTLDSAGDYFEPCTDCADTFSGDVAPGDGDGTKDIAGGGYWDPSFALSPSNREGGPSSGAVKRLGVPLRAHAPERRARREPLHRAGASG